MKVAYVVVVTDAYDTCGNPVNRILAVCPDEETAQQYQEISLFETVNVAAPMMESSALTVRMNRGE